MEVRLFLKNTDNSELLKIKRYTKLSMSIIKNNTIPLFAYVNFEDSEKNNYDVNYTNDFGFLKDLIIFLKNEHINYFIENYNDLEDLINDYTLKNQITKANDVLDRLREEYSTCESWEENINNEQRFFLKINGINYGGLEILKEKRIADE